ncbi:DUF2332 domain-containing protein [Nocardiopsis exhalans]|uniref:DUF2332 domain-containing protein n=1 Tax=Nocardiopsis exhalans TaxID=163604 RepID=A0ABY5DG15_9ACTN|nr:DUF2332 domain-containing protein [Nocardiopsis exhalans]USY23309.1 DUF2332 domain-containing protein [Nocardiopsis exhalans]
MVAAYRRFAASYAAGGSPDYERIALGVAEDEQMLDLVLSLPAGNKRQPNLLLGAVRFLGGPTDSFAGFAEWVVAHWDRVRAVVLERMTQTNEVRRCATLLPVLARWEGPLALIEVGASAGLCLYPDRYRYSYDGGAPIGPAHSPVLLECETRGPVPVPPTVPRVVWRAGLDLNPLDAGSEADVRWLESLIWPGRTRAGRVERLRAAASVAAAEPALLVRGGLLEALPELAAKAPEDATLVVFHSAVAAYLSVQERRQLEQMMGELPGHWISNEGGRVFPDWEHVRPPEPTHFTMAVDGRVVAYTGEHGQSVTWR